MTSPDFSMALIRKLAAAVMAAVVLMSTGVAAGWQHAAAVGGVRR
jgi:hypothetical protein